MSQRIASIQFMRFFAALLVVFNHSVNFVTAARGESRDTLFVYIGEFGQSGVHFFFVISGLIMVVTSANKFQTPGASWQFLQRRFLRIYPIYWLYGAIAFVAAMAMDGEAGFNAVQTLGAFLLAPGLSADLIFTGWSLTYEVYFYLAFALILPFAMMRGLVGLSCFFVVSVALGFLIPFENATTSTIFNTLLLEFVFGMWVGWLILYADKKWERLAVWAIAAGVLGFAIGIAIDFNRLPTAIAWGGPSALIIFGIAMLERGGKLPKFFERTAWLGDSSYSLYLVHAMLIGHVVSLLKALGLVTAVPAIFSVILLIPIMVIIGILAFEWIEKPLIGRLRAMPSAFRAAQTT
ncbi:MAG: acyltransferase [Pseudomonadota bacterium]